MLAFPPETLTMTFPTLPRPVTRRQVLQAGALPLLGVTLHELLAASAPPTGRARERPAEEVRLLLGFLAGAEKPSSGAEKSKFRPWEQLVQVVLLTNELLFVD